jgi:hypothetical protein
VDQAEEIPFDVFQELQGRLSQPGYPQQLMLTPNPPSEGHWIAREFHEDNTRRNFRYIRFSLDDNAHILGPDTTAAIKEAYPVGTSPYRRLIEGRRGLAASGEAVYRGYFNREIHVKPVEMDPEVAVLEGWDFGHAHPAVIWEQRLPWGEIRILGGVMGQDLFLADFVPIALRYRSTWCPDPLEIRSTCDPAGDTKSNQGIAQKATDLLADLGVFSQPCEAGNHVERRNFAIQRTADAMRRRTSMGEAFSVHPRFVVVTGAGRVIETEVLADGFEAGYVWDERAISNQLNPNTRRPKKDGCMTTRKTPRIHRTGVRRAATTRTTRKSPLTPVAPRRTMTRMMDDWRARPRSRGGYRHVGPVASFSVAAETSSQWRGGKKAYGLPRRLGEPDPMDPAWRCSQRCGRCCPRWRVAPSWRLAWPKLTG